MTQEELEKAYRAALDDAAKQLSYRGLSVQSLKEKLLKKGHAEDAVDYVIAWLIERHLLDDSRFAESAVHAYGRRGYGQMRIRQELRRRGVSREDTENALEAFSADPHTLHTLLDKKLKGDASDPKQVQKAIAFLQRRGFAWSDIREALKRYDVAPEETFD